MKIKTMTATFGKLQGERLTLEPGLNVITAPNEGGKSTWCAFLKAMFYGIDTRDRDRKGHLADKNRYQPWSGAPMEGEITLEWQGRDITIRRGPRGTVPFGTFSAVYTGTEEPVPGLTTDTCGQMLLGVGREVYERSAFIGQSGTLVIRSAPELEARIAALVSSGEEDVSYSQVERQLKEWLNRRKVNKSVGRIPQLEGERAELARSVDELSQLNDELNQLEGARAQAARRHTFCTGQLALHKAIAQRKLDRQYTQARAEEDQAQAQLDALLSEQARFGTLPSRDALKRAQGELAFLKALEPEIRLGQEDLERAQQALERARQEAQDDLFTGMTGDEAVRKGEQDSENHRSGMARKAASRRNFLLLQAAGVIAGGALAVFGPFWWLGPIAYVLCAAVSVLVWAGGKNAARQAEQILARYGVDQVEGIAALTGDYQRRVAAADQAAQQVRMIQGGLSDRQARLENSRAELFRFVHTFAPEVKELFGVSAALSRALNLGERETLARSRLEGAQRLTQALRAQGGRELTDEAEPAQPALSLEQAAQETGRLQVELERLDRSLNQARGKQQALGDPAALSARLEQVTEELERREREYQAISIAMDTLQQANAQLQQRFSPQLNRSAGALLSRLTGGKYRTLSLDKELDASAAEERDVLPHSALYLSKGTVDQIYLAVRLAVCDLCLPDAPLVLDEALAAFDDVRTKRALELLQDLAQQRQIVLFSCHHREKMFQS
ncbi:AAA family ATPase [Pseudoflavonifractor phocaeensis]|uniref:AAA family ATPase n=1 Tax=Pseudoflavonifractor phocaeensis TaxID=1870988 RepID=UPI0025A457D0|nr:AAA family ATPase [Pseudoflavonifractor phocaeensis]MDM8238649.1 AAA family ATPase [Pseudoflavonifractor phocaeensis]